ncbi:hypothetical protein QYE76_053788 [Lolium multiflorum]|uniref:Transposase-associated domain-containing protein n=1 Tax=Lolium multiflorum TaxID=4521 RepID=A0AAD8SX25_LOLMU|nr:hypothetical protein QYE76_053788 [Lolium multiflorum]
MTPTHPYTTYPRPCEELPLPVPSVRRRSFPSPSFFSRRTGGQVDPRAHEGHNLDVYCPRCTCMNGEKRPHHVVEDHLHIFGMDRTYVRWVYHGEPYNDPSAGEADLAHTMDGREGEKKRLLQETGFSSGTCAVPDEKKHRVEEVSQFDGRFEDESQFDAPVDGTDDEPFIDEGPAPEIIQPTRRPWTEYTALR